MSGATHGILAAFEYPDSTVDAIESLRKAGFEEIRVSSPYVAHQIEAAMGWDGSPVRVCTLVGGLTGAAAGFALTARTSLWSARVGGRPELGVPASIVIAFELSVLFAALAAVIALLIAARLPRTRPNVVYDPSFSSDRFGVFVRVPPGRSDEACRILRERGPAELRESAEADHA